MTRLYRPSTAEGLDRCVTPATRGVNRGFTIVELLIVIVVIALLAAVVTVAYSGVKRRAEESKVASDARNASQHLEMHRADNDRYPASDDTIPRSEGTSLQYTAASDGSSYCLTVSSGLVAYKQLSGGSPEPGVCDDHRAPGEPAPVVAGSCPSGFIPVPGNAKYSTSDFCVMKYEAKDVGGIAVSQPEGAPWQATRTDAKAAAQAACDGCRLMSDAEWLTVAHNALNVGSNWSGGNVGSGYVFSGHASGSPLSASADDANGYFGTGASAPSRQRRTLTLSNGEVIWDMAGNYPEIVDTEINEELLTAFESAVSSAGGQFVEWNTVELPGSINPNLLPGYGTPLAAGWTSAQGIGNVGVEAESGDNPLNISLVGYVVGGGINVGGSAGLLALYVVRNEEDDAGAAFRATV